MNLPEFIAEIETELRSFADTGLIDRVTIEQAVLNKIKILGANALETKETVLDIKNSTAQLPKDFRSLKLALKLDAEGCTIDGDRKDLTESYIYKQRIENPVIWSEITKDYVQTCDSKLVTEKITINNTSVDVYYRPKWLSLVKGIKKDYLTGDCLNLHPSIRNAYPHQISITNQTLNTNFSLGQVYIQYRGLMTDEDGEILIPEFSTGDIYEYIKLAVKVQLAEGWIANDENPKGLAQLFPMWKQEIIPLQRKALIEAKFGNLSKDWHKRFKTLNKREFALYKLPPLNFR